LNRITDEDTPSFYSARERDSNYSRSASFLEARRQQQAGGSVTLLDEEEEEAPTDMDMSDASSHSLVSSCSGEEDEDGRDVESSGQVESYTNGSELVEPCGQVRDFRQLALLGALRVLLCSRLVHSALLCYFFLVLAASTLNEVLPLWLVVPVPAGGLGFSGPLLGLTLLLSGLASLVMQLCVFPSAVHQSGLLPLIRNCLMTFFLVTVVMPCFCVPALQRVPVLPQALVVVSYLALTVAADWALVIVYVFLNNSCYSYQRATVNGISQALACCAMMLASLLGASFFALCESNTLKDRLPWPFHFAVVFWLAALLACAARHATFYMHRKIQKVRREPVFPRYAVQMEHFSVQTRGCAGGDDDEGQGEEGGGG
jgi:hypothetical protein